jgi:FdhE protein
MEFYKELRSIQSQVEQNPARSQSELSRETILNRLEQKSPLLVFDELEFDWPLIRDTFSEIIALFARYPDLFGPLTSQLEATGFSDLQLQKFAKIWYGGEEISVSLDATGGNKYLVAFALQNTLKPFVASYAKSMLGQVSQENWRQGFCPVCGGSPDFACLDKENGARWLLCERCDTSWLFQRMQCPYCGNQDQNTLSYFMSDDGLYRLYVCEVCKQYLKTIDLRQAKKEAELSLERLLTLGIDFKAKEYGYGDASPVVDHELR